ncbi:hypothetical protein Tco_0879710 [Tanacetum coccineum]
MSTLAEYMIVAGADNRLPLLVKTMYGSWESRMELFIEGKENGRIMLNSIKNRPLVWPTKVDEQGNSRVKTYEELTATQKLQADCDHRVANFVLQGHPPDIYTPAPMTNPYDATYHIKIQNQNPQPYHSQVNQIPLTGPTQSYLPSLVVQEPHTEVHQLASNLVVPTFQQEDDPIECINKVMVLLTTMPSQFPSTNNQLQTSSNPINQATIQDGRVTIQQVQRRQVQNYAGNGTQRNAAGMVRNNAAGQGKVIKYYNCQGKGHIARQCTRLKRPRNSAWFQEKLLLVQAQENDNDTTECCLPDCDDLSLAKVVLMANLSREQSQHGIPFVHGYRALNLDMRQEEKQPPLTCLFP